MTICRYYREGRCRYGQNCKYEHIDPPGGGNGGNDPFGTPTAGQGRSGGSKTDDPQWPLSVIGFKDNAEQGNELTGDWSPEELRVLAYSMAPRGISAEVTQRESQLVAEHQAKIDALSRGGLQTHAPSNSNNSFQLRDPFAQNPSVASQPNTGFGTGFGMANANGATAPQPQQSFGQPPQQVQAQHPAPFGAAVPQSGNVFGQNPGFAQTQPVQQPLPVQNPAPAANAGQESHFSAAQFGFAKVPEAAPPPKYY